MNDTYCFNRVCVCEITCPSSWVLWENIPSWSVGPSSAAGVWGEFPLLGRGATERLPAVEAPADRHGPQWPPGHTHTENKHRRRSYKILIWDITEGQKVFYQTEKEYVACLCVCVWLRIHTCRSSSRDPPRLISPRGMSGWRLCRNPWISVQMSRARDWALWTSCGLSAALVW